MNDPGFPVFDADNHLYESPAWTDHLPKRYARDRPVDLKLSFRS